MLVPCVNALIIWIGKFFNGEWQLTNISPADILHYIASYLVLIIFVVINSNKLSSAKLFDREGPTRMYTQRKLDKHNNYFWDLP